MRVKLLLLRILLKIKDLMLTCLNTKLEYKLTNITPNTGILIMKKAEQK